MRVPIIHRNGLGYFVLSNRYARLNARIEKAYAAFTLGYTFRRNHL